MTKQYRRAKRGGIETTTTMHERVGVTSLNKEQGGRMRNSGGGGAEEGDKYVGGSGEDFSCFISPTRSYYPHLKKPWMASSVVYH